jgi:hypothetical protein
MKKTLTIALAAAAALVSAQAFAANTATPLNFTSDSQVVPTMANVAGQNGAMFQTHISIMNPTNNAFAVTVSFYDGEGMKRSADINLKPGELKVYENFLDSIFKYTGAGAARFTAAETSGGGHNNRFVVSAEVWTPSAAGRFGTTVPVEEFAASSASSFAAGVTVGATSRTNVGCFNQASAQNVIQANVFDGTGKKQDTVDLTLPANAWGQKGVNVSVTGGYVEFVKSDAALCWAVVVDNASNDGRFVQAAEYTP